MRTPPLLADFTHTRVCKPFCEKSLTLPEANEMIDRYIHFYNHERIQLKTGEAPLTQRLSC